MPPARRRVGPAEAIEDIGDEVRRDALPVVRYRETQVAADGAELEPDAPARLGELTGGSSSGITASIAIFFAAAPGATTSIAACATSPSDTASIFSRSLPLMIRAMSSRSSTRRICAIALRSITSRAWARDLTEGWVCRMRVQPITALSGVRISCDSVARNWSFSRDASSAICRA